ncbi:MAG: cyclase family protein [Planctomycetes bacterium]|nr:cyclase family protein [Planctomycetota bacterium]
MRFRACLMLCVVGSLIGPSWRFSAAQEKAVPERPKVTKADVDKMMETLSNWGRWGKDDQLGTLNLITPAKRRAAAGLISEGVTVSLSHDASTTDQEGPPAFKREMLTLPKAEGLTFASDEFRVPYHGFTETHLDSLCHLSYNGKMYNGVTHKDVTERGAAKLSVLNFKQGIFTRCVLIDIPKLLEIRFLEAGQPIYPAHLDAWEKATNLKVEPGDVVLIRTGRWARSKVEGYDKVAKSFAGLHASCLPWLKARDVAIVGSDLALDVNPSQVEGVEFPVHAVVLVAMGTPILDNCDLEAVSAAAAERKRWVFAISVGPLAVPGGTGSPVNPLAIF